MPPWLRRASGWRMLFALTDLQCSTCLRCLHGLTPKSPTLLGPPCFCDEPAPSGKTRRGKLLRASPGLQVAISQFGCSARLSPKAPYDRGGLRARAALQPLKDSMQVSRSKTTGALNVMTGGADWDCLMFVWNIRWPRSHNSVTGLITEVCRMRAVGTCPFSFSCSRSWGLDRL